MQHLQPQFPDHTFQRDRPLKQPIDVSDGRTSASPLRAHRRRGVYPSMGFYGTTRSWSKFLPRCRRAIFEMDEGLGEERQGHGFYVGGYMCTLIRIAEAKQAVEERPGNINGWNQRRCRIVRMSLIRTNVYLIQFFKSGAPVCWNCWALFSLAVARRMRACSGQHPSIAETLELILHHIRGWTNPSSLLSCSFTCWLQIESFNNIWRHLCQSSMTHWHCNQSAMTLTFLIKLAQEKS